MCPPASFDTLPFRVRGPPHQAKSGSRFARGRCTKQNTTERQYIQMNKKSSIDSKAVRRSGRHRFRVAFAAVLVAAGGAAALSVAASSGSAVVLRTQPIFSSHPATPQVDVDGFYTWRHFVPSQNVAPPAPPPASPPEPAPVAPPAPPPPPLAAHVTHPVVPSPVPAPSPAATPVVTSSSPGGVWACIRSHESGGSYGTNTGNGYYGAYQFTLSTWRSVGGTGLPSQAAPAEQDMRAQILQARSGWSPWPQTSRVCGA
jgi:hypothetical protein